MKNILFIALGILIGLSSKIGYDKYQEAQDENRIEAALKKIQNQEDMRNAEYDAQIKLIKTVQGEDE